MTKDVKIVVALNYTPPSLKALDLAVKHCLSLKVYAFI